MQGLSWVLLERNVSAELTGKEAERLVAEEVIDAKHGYRVWCNAAKQALLGKSVDTVQALRVEDLYVDSTWR